MHTRLTLNEGIITLDNRKNYYRNIEQNDLFWLAGLLEGEGCFGFYRNPRVSVKMIDEDIIARVANLFGNKYHKTEVSKENHKNYYSTRTAGIHAVHLMVRLYPLLGKRRHKQIRDSIEKWKGNDVNHKITPDQAREIYERTHKGNESQREIAEDYPISRETVKDIKLGLTWSHLTGE